MWVSQGVIINTSPTRTKGSQASYMQGRAVNNILNIMGGENESKKRGEGAIILKAIKGDPFS